MYKEARSDFYNGLVAYMKYRYTGTDEKHLPKQGVLVRPGDVVKTSEPINHPDFELVQEEEKGKKKSDN